ncbi:MAG: Crp/Fnr family transcriptional regulator [Myxococcota bacterium]
MDRRELLRRVPLFEGLDERELDRLIEATTTKRLAAKDVLFRKGDSGNQLYAVLSGRLKATGVGLDGQDVVFAWMGPGEFLGEIALLDESPRSATVVAVEATVLVTLHRRDFVPFLERHPRAAIALARALAARVRRLSERAEERQTMALPTRIAKRLVALAADHGRRPVVGGPVEVRLPQQDLADLVGTTRESVNKHLREWEEAGLVRLGRGRIVLLDREGLAALAGPDLR